ncbi:zinc-binding alcohol dehydrogenase family protein [Pseudomonas putida]|uniref:quinone oxidoreductase family protein n=1 Tax=Pseudomonas putida TaxID=303 RepID=UPI00236362A8|nr:zinc-binding alcohol dehydrogenase family protein [Pseudomonas putida]MDD2054403.1 zinc-binding alcohol dehydrogenase family protein [Pseudomonas putida]
MKALQFSRTGDLAALNYVEVPQPEAAAGQVLVAVKAAGLNPSDVKNVLGRFPYTTLPRIPGRDFAGVVVQGPEHLLGQAVWGTGSDLGFTGDGSHAAYLTLPADGVALKPASLSFAQAASLGVPYTTAWDALERSQVGPGTTLLVIGANGAVGRAALALAQIRGARVLAAVRRPEQAQALQACGYSVIELQAPEALGEQVSSVFPGGAQVVFDTTGHWLPAAVSALAVFGRIAIIAAPLDGHVQLPALGLYRKGGALIGTNTLLYNCAACARMLEQFGGYFDRGLLPLPNGLVESPLADGPARYAEVDRGASAKVILVP